MNDIENIGSTISSESTLNTKLSKYENYAGLLVRAIAYIIDIIILLIIIIIPFLGVTWSMNLHYSLERNTLYPFLMITLLIVSWLYFAGFESSRFMATPGKLLLGIKVSDMMGNRISFTKATLRYSIKWGIPSIMNIFLPQCLGGIYFLGNVLAMYTNEERQCGHDMIAGTVVTEKINKVSS